MKPFLEQVKQTLENPLTTGFLGDVENAMNGVEPSYGISAEDLKRQIEDLKSTQTLIEEVMNAIDNDSDITDKEAAKQLAKELYA